MIIQIARKNYFKLRSITVVLYSEFIKVRQNVYVDLMHFISSILLKSGFMIVIVAILTKIMSSTLFVLGSKMVAGSR